MVAGLAAGPVAVLLLWQALALGQALAPAALPALPVRAALPAIPRLPSGPIEGPVDRIVIDKTGRLMVAFQGGRPVRGFQVALGFAPEGDKARQGDGRTPEGIFRVDRRNGTSRFHLSLGLDYPRPQDRARARAAGLPPGGDIFIHGQPNGRVAPGFRIKGDWTDGCIAVSDAEIADLFAATRIGTEVEIRP